jgi:hypothetical protein
MNSGDLCLFYTSDAALGHNQYNWLAKVSEIRRSPEISEAFWDSPDFEWVYFLDEPSKLNLSVQELASEVARFRPDYLSRAPMGIMPLDPEVLRGLIQAHGDIESWLKTRFGLQPNVESDFLTIMRRYKDEHTVFCSSRRGVRYAIEAVDENGCTIKRLDANENTRCTTSLLAGKLELVRSKGGIHPFDDSFDSGSDAFGKKGPTVKLQKSLLNHSAHEIGDVDLVNTVAKTALEAITIEKREEQLEIRFFAVMRSRCHEQEMAR